MNVLDLLGRHGISARKVASTKGGEYHSPCPGCGGKDRFHVWPEQNNGEGSYWCRQCGKAGDAIQFLMDFEGLSFKEACERLGKKVSDYPERITPCPPSQRKKTEYEPREAKTPEEKWQARAKKLVLWANEQLLKNQKQLQWLAERGIKRETVLRFSLGWNPGERGKDIFRSRESWGLKTILKENGKPKKLWIPIGLVIPFIQDKILRIRIRRFSREEPRYYIIPGSSTACMVIPCLEKKERSAVIVVESELDAILLAQEAGDMVSVVALGSSNTKPESEAYNFLKQADVILLALDFDDAGAKAISWWLDMFGEKVDVWPVPEGKDPGDAYKAGVDIREWVLAGLPPAWTIGRFFLNGKDEKKGKSAPSDHQLPSTVQELAYLLRRHSVKIDLRDGISILEPPGWAKKNWEVARRISYLVFFDDDVSKWLLQEEHDGKVISYRDFK